ncbi:hypothetical protein AHMF7616_00322 [Adhaeribacter pallidiroseus]|uniref:Uncharacterized protein n=1 Tax=Adhaeribacter pallidiroseus TaxID=2072847 RepID=A0A369QBM5_9BACT|nr:hypothetical protein AHMF7616_00322 [Adhaeribacter pallidiroseus]
MASKSIFFEEGRSKFEQKFKKMLVHNFTSGWYQKELMP